jgi:hypothetical protein
MDSEACGHTFIRANDTMKIYMDLLTDGTDMTVSLEDANAAVHEVFQHLLHKNESRYTVVGCFPKYDQDGNLLNISENEVCMHI